VTLWVLSFGLARGDEPSSPSLAPRARQPVALALSRDGGRLYVANRRSGSLSVVDPTSARVVAEHDVGRGLSDVVALPDPKYLLALDQPADSLLLLEARDRSVQVVGRRQVAPDPVSVLVAPDGGWCVVASRWSRRLTFVELSMRHESAPPALGLARSLDLPFSPRNMVLARGGVRLVVADAFGGKLAVVDPKRGALESVRSLPAHNIRGLAESPDGQTLVVAHQSLNTQGRTNFDHVHWGALVNSHVRSLRMDAVLSAGSDGDLLEGGCVVSLGFTGSGAGDPAGLAVDGSGGVAVALSGVDEVAIARSPSGYFRRIGVGRRPSALALSPDGKTVYVADSLDDTVTVVDVPSGRRAGTISLGPRPESTPADLGERLFYDARLSHDGWMSCHSCHTDGNSNGRLADTLGDGSYGAPKRIPSLLGTGATGPWTWTGSVDRLEDQVRKSVERTMTGRAPSVEQVEALTAYLRSLAPPRAVVPDDTGDAVGRGRKVFHARNCAECHVPPRYTAKGTYDVGLADESGRREFNPPSLRGVGLREPLLHDGRAATLEDVFLKHGHPRDTEMTREEVADLVAFLKTL
jgi:YVTN family beta-propeller protein